MRVAAIGDGDGGGDEMRVVVTRRWVGVVKDVVVLVEEENDCLLMPKSSVGFCRRSIWASCGSEGKRGRYIALISTCNKVQHGAGGYCEFLDI